MGCNRIYRNHQLIGDLLVRATGSQLAQHLDFACCKAVRVRRFVKMGSESVLKIGKSAEQGFIPRSRAIVAPSLTNPSTF